MSIPLNCFTQMVASVLTNYQDRYLAYDHHVYMGVPGTKGTPVLAWVIPAQIDVLGTPTHVDMTINSAHLHKRSGTSLVGTGNITATEQVLFGGIPSITIPYTGSDILVIADPLSMPTLLNAARGNVFSISVYMQVAGGQQMPTNLLLSPNLGARGLTDTSPLSSVDTADPDGTMPLVDDPALSTALRALVPAGLFASVDEAYRYYSAMLSGDSRMGATPDTTDGEAGPRRGLRERRIAYIAFSGNGAVYHAIIDFLGSTIGQYVGNRVGWLTDHYGVNTSSDGANTVAFGDFLYTTKQDVAAALLACNPDAKYVPATVWYPAVNTGDNRIRQKPPNEANYPLMALVQLNTRIRACTFAEIPNLFNPGVCFDDSRIINGMSPTVTDVIDIARWNDDSQVMGDGLHGGTDLHRMQGEAHAPILKNAGVDPSPYNYSGLILRMDTQTDGILHAAVACASGDPSSIPSRATTTPSNSGLSVTGLTRSVRALWTDSIGDLRVAFDTPILQGYGGFEAGDAQLLLSDTNDIEDADGWTMRMGLNNPPYYLGNNSTQTDPGVPTIFTDPCTGANNDPPNPAFWTLTANSWKIASNRYRPFTTDILFTINSIANKTLTFTYYPATLSDVRNLLVHLRNDGAGNAYTLKIGIDPAGGSVHNLAWEKDGANFGGIGGFFSPATNTDGVKVVCAISGDGVCTCVCTNATSGAGLGAGATHNRTSAGGVASGAAGFQVEEASAFTGGTIDNITLASASADSATPAWPANTVPTVVASGGGLLVWPLADESYWTIDADNAVEAKFTVTVNGNVRTPQLVNMVNGNGLFLHMAAGDRIVDGATVSTAVLTANLVVNGGGNELAAGTATATNDSEFTGIVTGVSVSSPRTTLALGGTVQLTAVVSGSGGTPSQSVTWTVVSGLGSVSSSGLYTAPNTQTTARVRATSDEDISVYGEILLTVASGGSGGGASSKGRGSVKSPSARLSYSRQVARKTP